MGNFIRLLQEKQKSPTAIYHKFRTSSLRSDCCYIFVEGYEDKEFYPQKFLDAGGKAHTTVCFGKKNLDKVFEEFKNSPVERVKVGFIRDSDFDFFLGKISEAEEFFITCGYAVENYVCSEESLSRYIIERMGVDENEVDHTHSLATYRELVDDLNNWLIPVYARVFQAISECREIDLDKLNIQNYAKMHLRGNGLPDINTIDDLKKMGFDEGIPVEKYFESANEYSKKESFLALRGKYLLAVATEFLKFLSEELLAKHKAKEIINFNRAVCSQINCERVFADLAPRSAPAGRLSDWIQNQIG
ncbi:DUF4435 domain-containing protein [Phaeobacter italicus]|uniref:DUF4435 domain-containing protein n=1 Tax=Phaeobacter italicus TaxID=481446 RepID=UPI001C9595F7|nr:DUF4435 domain-containing protein [Phaeobacter italicus]MBY6042398.1 DUF4435 domain-containing protein [Phaeobacter italicus]